MIYAAKRVYYKTVKYDFERRALLGIAKFTIQTFDFFMSKLLRYSAISLCFIGLYSCLKEDECASKTLCVINDTGSDQQVVVSGDHSANLSITSGSEKCLDLASDVEDIKLKWTGSEAEFILDQCYTDYTLN